MSWSRRKAAAIGLALLLSGGCGFEPLYDEGGAASRLKNAVIFEASGDDLGFELEGALTKRFGSPSAPRYVVKVRTSLHERETVAGGLGGFERYELSGAGQFEVRAIGDGEVKYEGIVQGSAAYSSTRETFHTLTARRDARRRLVVQLADRIARRLEAAAESWLE